MSPRRLFVIVALVGLGAAGTWAWQHGAQQSRMKVASALEQPRSPPPAPSAPVSEIAPAPTPETVKAADPAPRNDRQVSPVSPPPTDVDTPEPAERKFSRGTHSSAEEH